MVGMGRKAVSTGEHGTNKAYLKGCHCDLCKRARADYVLEWRQLTRACDDPDVRRAVAAAGKLSPEQMDRLRTLLPAVTGDDQAEAGYKALAQAQTEARIAESRRVRQFGAAKRRVEALAAKSPLTDEERVELAAIFLDADQAEAAS
jgi:hypothetical protein